MNIILFILTCYGLTQILCYGKIFDKIRPKQGFLGELFGCSLCVGFHVGYVVTFLSQFSLLIKWEPSVIDYLFLSCISSGCSYLLDKMVGDEGFNVSRKDIK